MCVCLFKLYTHLWQRGDPAGAALGAVVGFACARFLRVTRCSLVLLNPLGQKVNEEL